MLGDPPVNDVTSHGNYLGKTEAELADHDHLGLRGVLPAIDPVDRGHSKHVVAHVELAFGRERTVSEHVFLLDRDAAARVHDELPILNSQAVQMTVLFRAGVADAAVAT
jgi:hypothetical protein